MHDEDSERPELSQTPGEHRVVWRGKTPLIAESKDDGVVTLYPLQIVPDAVWDMPIARLCALPDWANNINDPTQQFLVLLARSGTSQLEAIDALNKIKAHVEATRILIEGGVTNLTEKRLADLLDMVKATLGTLDP